MFDTNIHVQDVNVHGTVAFHIRIVYIELGTWNMSTWLQGYPDLCLNFLNATTNGPPTSFHTKHAQFLLFISASCFASLASASRAEVSFQCHLLPTNQ